MKSFPCLRKIKSSHRCLLLQHHLESVKTIVASCSGLMLPPLIQPRLVSRLSEGFYGPTKSLQPVFGSPSLPDIWQCVETSWGWWLHRDSLSRCAPPRRHTCWPPVTMGFGMVDFTSKKKTNTSSREVHREGIKTGQFLSTHPSPHSGGWRMCDAR